MYFWYSRGIPPMERSCGFGLRMYQSLTRSIPSGLAWTKRMTTSLRMRVVSASSRLTICHSVSMSCCAPSTSVACSPPSIHTTALPSAARRAAAALSTCPMASVRLVSRQRSRFRWFSGLVTMAIICERPSAVRPMSTRVMRSLSPSSFRQ